MSIFHQFHCIDSITLLPKQLSPSLGINEKWEEKNKQIRGLSNNSSGAAKELLSYTFRIIQRSLMKDSSFSTVELLLQTMSYSHLHITEPQINDIGSGADWSWMEMERIKHKIECTQDEEGLFRQKETESLKRKKRISRKKCSLWTMEMSEYSSGKQLLPPIAAMSNLQIYKPLWPEPHQFLCRLTAFSATAFKSSVSHRAFSKPPIQEKKLHQKLHIESNIKKVKNKAHAFSILFLLTFQKLLLSVEEDNSLPGNKVVQQVLQQLHLESSPIM